MLMSYMLIVEMTLLSTTKTDEIEECTRSVKNQIIFTNILYSLYKITSSPSIEVSVMYCDEAHNSCSKQFFDAVKVI